VAVVDPGPGRPPTTAAVAPLRLDLDPDGDTNTRLLTRAGEVLALSLSGLSERAIAHRLGINPVHVRRILDVEIALDHTPDVERMRTLENARLDVAQASIWDDVIADDHTAIKTFLAISTSRAKLNGLNAPVQVDVNVQVRQDMVDALTALENVVLGTVLDESTDGL
jgi:hypothetical protein